MSMTSVLSRDQLQFLIMLVLEYHRCSGGVRCIRAVFHKSLEGNVFQEFCGNKNLNMPRHGFVEISGSSGFDEQVSPILNYSGSINSHTCWN